MTPPTPPVPPLEVRPGDPEPPLSVFLLRNHGRDEAACPWLLRINPNRWAWTDHPVQSSGQRYLSGDGWLWDTFTFSGPLVDCSEAMRIRPAWVEQGPPYERTD